MKAMRHQAASLRFMKDKPAVLDFSDPGCVSADTEFLTPTGWKRIDKYVEGDMVAQFHPHKREIEFVLPTEYVKRPCQTMIAIAPNRGTSQRLSHEHRVLYYTPDGKHHVVSAQQYAEQLWQQGPGYFKAKFCTTFSVRTSNKLPLNDYELRVMVAVIADGHFQVEATNRCVIRLKKDRKIQRLHELLMKSKIEYSVRQCGGAPDFVVFTFVAPLHHKEFGDYWWGASQLQLEIIADELCYWDSSEDKRGSDGTRFSSFSETSATFAQYAFSAAKRPASLTYSVRDRREEARGVMIEYTVHARSDDCLVGPGRKTSVYEIPNPEGFKYCFEVPSSFLLLRHSGYIFATGNTGKTYAEVIDFARRHKVDGKAMLVFCPKSIMYAAWGQDCKKFAPHLRVQLCDATNRLEKLNTPADVYVVNIDGASDLLKLSPMFWRKFGTLVVDEANSVKHRTTGRSKAVLKLRQRFAFVRLMTGTPACNGICDIWHLAFIADGGQRLGKSFFGFRAACCTPVQTGPSAHMLEWQDRPGIANAVAALLADITIRHAFEDCVDIPKNHAYSRCVQLSPAHRKNYEKLESDKYLEISKVGVTAVNGAVLATKLLQAASGAVYNDQGGYSLVATDRYALVLDLVEERKHSIVFYLWAHQRDELVKEAQKRKLSFAVWDSAHPEVEKEFQAGAYQVLFAHPASAGHGLTFTKATATIWPSPTPNLDWFEQGLKRIHRIGQTQSTETIVVVAENTFDERMWASLQRKKVSMTELFGAFKDAA